MLLTRLREKRRGSGCCQYIDGLFFFVLLLVATVKTDVRAVAGLLDPVTAAVAFLLCRSKQEQHTADKHTHR